MKKRIYPLLAAFIAIAVASCNIKENMDDCPPEETRICLEFECKHIYDEVNGGMKEHITFDRVTRQLELLFYDKQGRLVYDNTYTAAELAVTGWKVYLRDELPGVYTLLAHVNYNDDRYSVSGKESLATLLSRIDYDDNNRVDYPLADTYYGQYELELDYGSGVRCHKIMLSKNTNYINVFVAMQGEQSDVSRFESVVTGSNAFYGWDNSAPAHDPVFYSPYQSSFGDGEPIIKDLNKTMRIWHGSDLALSVYVTTRHNEHTKTLDIPALLSRVVKYDSDEKLEHYDEFFFEVTFSEENDELVIIGLKVNGWFLVIGGEDV